MKTSLVEQLLCPNCGAALIECGKSSSPADEIEFGIITCGCSEYPVIAGIPILKSEGRVDVMDQTRDSVSRVGPAIKDLLSLLRAGENEKALLSLLVIPNRRVGQLLTIASGAHGRIQREIRAFAYRLWSIQQRRDREFFLGQAERTTAVDLLDYFYRHSLQSELASYFIYRFAQPRHLAGLCVAGLLPASGRPILDLACGFGHYMHYLRRLRADQPVIGIDRNFFQLYVAKTRVAPGCDYLCSEADERLPFRSRNISGIFCSDAFHCFRGRWQCAEEMKRILEPGGLIILSRFGNSQVEPREGYELTVKGYLSLFEGLNTRMVSEEKLVEGYQKKLGPQLEEPPDITYLTSQKWLSLLASNDKSLFRNYPIFKEWPHAIGKYTLNPLYQEIGKDPDGNVIVEFRFPSKWYEFENSACLQYMPKKIGLSKEICRALSTGTWMKEMEPLIQQCVIVGMPDRYI